MNLKYPSTKKEKEIFYSKKTIRETPNDLLKQEFFFRKYREFFITNQTVDLRPKRMYDSFRTLINQDGKIIDIGSGNGLLLKYLYLFSGFKLIPFGIDNRKIAIDEAQKNIFPELKNNFKFQDAVFYEFEDGPFNIIIACPIIVDWRGRNRDFVKKFIKKCFKNLTNNGRLILFAPYDVLERSKEKGGFGGIKYIGRENSIIKTNLKFWNYNPGNYISFAIIDKNGFEK